MDVVQATAGSVDQTPHLVVPEFGNGLAVVIVFGLAAGLVFVVTPTLIRKMREGGMVGADVNKAGRPTVAELGGIAALFAFSVSLTTIVGVMKLLGYVTELPFLAAISVFFMAAMIGLIDDISNLRQRFKAVVVAFAALPLMLVHLGPEVIDLPFGYSLNFAGGAYLWYWLILVPIGVTGAANAMNMSAGYNGLESGQIAIVSLSLLGVGYLQGASEFALLIFAALAGCGIGLYAFNRFPARVFIGDIGTLGLGAALGAGAILGHVEFYALLAIVPAFYEAGATLYYGLRGTNGERRRACHDPVISEDGTLRPRDGASRFTLANLVLSRKPMTERGLVRTLLSLYAASGAFAILMGVL